MDLRQATFEVLVLAGLFTLTRFAKGGIAIDTTIGGYTVQAGYTPPATLGGYPMMAFPTDSRAEGSWVATIEVPEPYGSLTLSLPFQRWTASGSEWALYYSGQVPSGFFDRTITLPSPVKAVYLYVDNSNPMHVGYYTFNSGGTTATLQLEPDPFWAQTLPRCIGFYSDDAVTDITSINIHALVGNEGFDMMQFGINAGPEPPVLSIEASGSDVVLSWPADVAGFALYQNSGLTPANWQLVTNTPVVVSGQNQVVLSPRLSGPQFFRLQSQ